MIHLFDAIQWLGDHPMAALALLTFGCGLMVLAFWDEP